MTLRLGQNLANIHIIGHSLGGHLAGFIAREMAKEGKKIFRVTGSVKVGREKVGHSQGQCLIVFVIKATPF